MKEGGDKPGKFASCRVDVKGSGEEGGGQKHTHSNFEVLGLVGLGDGWYETEQTTNDK